MSEVLKLVDIWKIYGSGGNKIAVLKGINLSIKRGELVIIMGPSGSGKSTLLSIIGTLDRPTKGKVYIGGVNVTSLNEDELVLFRSRRIGFVFQSYNLIKNLTALENVMLPMILSRLYDVKEAEKKALELLKLVGLGKHAHKFPKQMSGGQQQRVAIARALATDPDLILMDEPTGNLDLKSSAQVVSLIKWLNEVYGQTFLIVTHNPELVEVATRVLYIRDGRIYENPPKQLLAVKLKEELAKMEKSSTVREAQLKLLEIKAQALKRLALTGSISESRLREELEYLRLRVSKLESLVSK
ncbi:MAG: ABC transporter ATP-binding protein [Thermoprotei archaeon]|nr:MAG: ABC transporter ATP-binding protein [Thermoprotei archaeon]